MDNIFANLFRYRKREAPQTPGVPSSTMEQSPKVQGGDYAERIVSLEEAIAALRDPEVSNRETNRVLRSIVERIEYSSPPVGSKETNITLDVYLRL